MRLRGISVEGFERIATELTDRQKAWQRQDPHGIATTDDMESFDDMYRHAPEMFSDDLGTQYDAAEREKRKLKEWDEDLAWGDHIQDQSIQRQDDEEFYSKYDEELDSEDEPPVPGPDLEDWHRRKLQGGDIGWMTDEPTDMTDEHIWSEEEWDQAGEHVELLKSYLDNASPVVISELLQMFENNRMGRTAESLWNQYSGQDPRVDHLLTVMGFGPDGPPLEKKATCPECGEQEMVVREIHADTDMNEMVHRCLNCRVEIEI